MKTIALINNKGGVGKTTVAINLSAYLASKQLKVLLIDLDWQRSAGLSLGFGRNPEGITIADILFNNKPVKQGIRNTNIKNIDIIPASSELANKELIDLNMLKKQIKQVKGNYDFVFIDCNPGLSSLSKNALVSADRVIIPITPDYLSVEGLVLLTKELIYLDDSVKILFNQIDRRTRNTSEVIEFIRKEYKDKVFKIEIKRNIRITESASWHKSIFDYDPHSTGAECFNELGKEFLKW